MCSELFLIISSLPLDFVLGVKQGSEKENDDNYRKINITINKIYGMAGLIQI